MSNATTSHTDPFHQANRMSDVFESASLLAAQQRAERATPSKGAPHHQTHAQELTTSPMGIAQPATAVSTVANSPGMARHILVVEDERDLADMLKIHLENAGYTTDVVHDGRDALTMIQTQCPDLVLLDLMLPGMHGTEVARRVRTDHTLARVPIVMLTAKSQEKDELVGLDLGADDYITKPFSMKVLLARIDAVLRRAEAAAGAQVNRMGLSLGPVDIDPEACEATYGGEPIELTRTEFRILLVLVQAQGRVMSREAIMRRAIGPGINITERTVDVHMTAIRRKLKDAGELIKTVRGVGYKAVSP
ncbi:MAG: response regulator transcription factor [Phycisphaerales bacterium]